jgi:enamine deaminase RidA (YjgF/YER057c/UK114 family)
MKDMSMSARQNISSGTHWEAVAGYSRLVRVNNLVEVAGTTAVDEHDQVVGPGDPYQQTKFILAKIERALLQAGATLQDVVRTRMFVVDISRWEEIARAHVEVFRDIRPAATMVEVRALIRPELLVEIEAAAVLQEMAS